MLAPVTLKLKTKEEAEKIFNITIQPEKEIVMILVDSKIKTTYIILDPLFKDCVFERDGWYEKFRK